MDNGEFELATIDYLMVAALMSTLASALNGAAPQVTNDFIKARRPERVGRTTARTRSGGFVLALVVLVPFR